MATASKRDVKLTVGVDVNGQEGLSDLAGGLRGVGEAAVQSAPNLDRMAAELDALAASTKAARDAEAASKAEAAAARAELNAQADALARLRAGSDSATRATQDFKAQETALKVALTEARIALRDKNAAAADAASESKAAALAEKELAAALQAARVAAAAAAREQAAANANVGETLKSLKGQLDALRNVAALALGGSLVGSLARDLADTADSYANLAARVKLATGEGAAFKTSFAEVQAVAQRVGVNVEDVGALFVKLSQAGKELNLTSADALRLAESISQATQLSGASAQEAASAVTQLGQALASGRLQGDELRSLLENSPRLAKALADGLSVTVGQLKDLGSAGALTAQQVVAALQGQSQALNAEFQQLPVTVGRSLTNLSNAWTAYVGEADKGTGASHAAADAIQALAGHLDTVAAVLYSAGKAAAAYSAVRLAQSFIDTATAARAAAVATEAATAATAAHTAATVANSAAQVEGAAAAAATVGRLAGLLSTLKLGLLIGVVTNLKEIGTAIGEWVGKLTTGDAALKELDAQLKADEAASRAGAAAAAALAQAKQQAADAALGLTKESRALVAEFESVITKGGTAADAVAKLAKSLELGDINGIQTASTALDALGQRGVIAGQQIRDALANALKGLDLGTFETQARAAFDGSTQGARRLAAALDALATESLRRAGTSVQELRTGFSAASVSAINDLDALANTLQALGIKSPDAGRALSAALDHATQAAGTERAAQAVIDRIEALGRAGVLTGQQLSDALEKARKKLDDLGPGITSLGEALHTFGLNTKAELQATADRLAAAYQQIANSADVSIQDQIRAFGQFRDAAIAANKGVEPYQVALQRRILESRAGVAGLGDAFEAAMNKAKAATDAAATALAKYEDLLKGDPSRLVGGDGLAGFGADTAPNGGPSPAPAEPAPSSGQNATTGPNAGKANSVLTKNQYDAQGFALNADGSRFTAVGPVQARSALAADVAAQIAAQLARDAAARAALGATSTPSPAAAQIGASVNISVNIGGKPYNFTSPSMQQAEQVIAALEAAYAAGGG